MRQLTTTIVLLAGCAICQPALALQPSDSMRAWKDGSAKDRADLLGTILGKPSGDPASEKIQKCLDATSDIPGHADLTIQEVVKFCASSKDAGQPV